MGIFDFDWMDLNHDGRVDDLERAFGFSILEDEERMFRAQHRQTLWEDTPEETDETDDPEDASDGDDWF